MIDQDTVLTRNPGVAFRRMSEGNGSLLLHVQTAEYHGLNEVGSLIWELLENEIRCERLFEDMRARLSSTPEGLETEIREFLEDLVERDLIHVAKD